MFTNPVAYTLEVEALLDLMLPAFRLVDRRVVGRSLMSSAVYVRLVELTDLTQKLYRSQLQFAQGEVTITSVWSTALVLPVPRIFVRDRSHTYCRPFSVLRSVLTTICP